MVTLLAVLLGALLLTSLSYRGRLQPLAGWAAFARWVATALLLLLLLDPGLPSTSHPRPLVLVDHSLSLHATGGRLQEADSLARILGDPVPFGELASAISGNASLLAQPLRTALASGRPVILITDGEIGDAEALSGNLLSQVTVRLLPRPSRADFSIERVEAPERAVSGDSITVVAEVERTVDAPDSTLLELTSGNTTLVSTMVRFSGRRERVSLTAAIPDTWRGLRWLELQLQPGDQEPGNDLRWLGLEITPSPGIVLLLTAPDPDGRELYRTLREVTEIPVAGYARLQPGRWFRMENLRPVSEAVVLEAARQADLLAVRGDPAPWLGSGKSRLLWQPGEQSGDWFLSPELPSPLSGALVGLAADSLPPLKSVSPLTIPPDGWVAWQAQRSRQGSPVSLVVGSQTPRGRTLRIAGDGFFGWANRGGATAQVWRTLVARGATWLLETPVADSSRVRLVKRVTPRGDPVQFQWMQGDPAPEVITLEGPGGSRVDTLRFDAERVATLALESGRYHYRLASGGAGELGVEPWSAEFFPGKVTLMDRPATAGPVGSRVSWRTLRWLFALAVAAFGVEWVLRRRMGSP